MTAIYTEGLRKVYPLAAPKRGGRPAGTPFGPPGAAAPPVAVPGGVRELVALEGLDLHIQAGEFFGLLGPNGAGKTTTIGILTTRVLASAGRATVAGADVINDPVAVRRRIGVVPQRANPDRGLNVIENLIFHSAYFGIGRAEATTRATALLEQFGMGEKAAEKVDALSGGQQQRLMIARALIHQPDVLFLDEPTVGLDPAARLALWDVLRALHRQGRTIVMTTHYMEEADQLCDRLAIIDRGKLLALDTTTALKAKAPGGTLIDLDLDGPAAAAATAVAALPNVSKAEGIGATLRIQSSAGGRIISAAIEAVEGAGRHVKNITLKEPSLETLFIELTGRKLG
ncbi:MAG: transporter related protein [Gemmatimonadetes bacterium]|nr:transporter related protein [Gemmatimonadota bacterium]